MEPTLNNARNSDPKTPDDASRDEYLARQVADAKLALESTLDDFTLDLARAADLRRWVRRYPWVALGTALVAGFTAAHVVKSKGHENKGRGAAENGGVPGANASAPDQEQSAQRQSPRPEPPSGWRSTISNSLFDILRLVVTQFISAGVRHAAAGGVHPHPPANQARPTDNMDSPNDYAAETTRDSSDSPLRMNR